MATKNLLAAIVLLFVVSLATSLAGQTYPLNQQNPVTAGFSSGGVANCQRGWRFQVNAANVTVTQLGCWYPDGTTQPKTVTLFNFTTQAILAQVSCGPGTGWQFTTLTTPVPLQNGSQYLVIGHTVTASYYWMNTPPASWNPTGTIQYFDTRYANGVSANTFPTSILSPHQYGVVDIGYTNGPTISTSTSTLALGNAFQGTAGAPASYTVSGAALTGPTTLTAPANVELCDTQSGTYQDTWQITSTGTWGPTTMWARIKSTAPLGSITGNISHVSAGATTVNVAVNGNVQPVPSLGVNPSTLNLGTTSQGTPGATQNYQVTGTDTVDQTNITAPAGVELSFNQTTWATTLAVTSTGTWAATTVYVRIAASASAGAISGNVSNSTVGATTQNVNVSGTVNAPPSLVANPTSLNLGSTPQGVPGAEFSYNLVGANLTANTVITAPAGVEISETSGGTFSGTITITTTPSFNIDIFVRLTGATMGAVSGDITNVSGSASEDVAINGTVTQNLNLNFLRNGPGATAVVDNDDQGAGGNGLVILDFEASTGTDPFTLTDITFTESGTADGQTAISFIALYEDSGNGTWDGPGTDTLATATAGTSFNGANGTYTATLSTTAIAANTTRQFFLVVKLAGMATAGQTIQAEATAATANTGGTGTVVGLPTTAANTALTIDVATLGVTFSGPAAFTTVNADSQGAGNNGHVILDVSLQATNDSWTVTSMTFTASGTADEQADINFLALYIDDGNNTFDGPGTDTLATAAAGTSFNAPNGTYTATLTGAASTFGVNGAKRLFLVAKLAGSATSGETFRAALTSMVQTSPSAGAVTGLPTVASSALVIDVATLSVNAGPANPADAYVEFSGAFTHTLGEYRLTASNDNFTVSGVTLTLGGNGDWVNNIGQLRMYLDNGNGTFDGADTQLFAGSAGVASINCTFSTNVTINAGTSSDLWAVIDVAATAGGSPSESFDARIQSPADVQQVTAGNVLIGSQTPQSGMLHVIIFATTGFTPVTDAFAGGAFITITGSGFALPTSCTINGVPCTGTATVNATGTTITGLRVPGGSGSGLTIVLTTNNLGPKTLTQTFKYQGNISSGGGGGGGGGGGCSAEAGTPAALVAILGLLACLVVRRREV